MIQSLQLPRCNMSNSFRFAILSYDRPWPRRQQQHSFVRIGKISRRVAFGSMRCTAIERELKGKLPLTILGCCVWCCCCWAVFCYIKRRASDALCGWGEEGMRYILKRKINVQNRMRRERESVKWKNKTEANMKRPQEWHTTRNETKKCSQPDK